MAKESKFRLKDLFNLFDIVVLAIAVLLGVILVLFSRGAGKESTTVIYTVEFTNMQNGTAGLIQPGDSLVDRVKKFDLGKVLSVEVGPTYNQLTNTLEGGTKEAASQTLQTATVVLEAPATETEQDFLVSGGFLIKIGTSVSAKGPGYSCYGTVLAIEKGGEGK